MVKIQFNDTQKAAMVSLLIEMINADNVVDPSECDAQLLTRVIDADARDDDKEIKLFNIICNVTGVDVLINAMNISEE